MFSIQRLYQEAKPIFVERMQQRLKFFKECASFEMVFRTPRSNRSKLLCSLHSSHIKQL